eukprot:3218786-Rhodomonas_salina.1
MHQTRPGEPSAAVRYWGANEEGKGSGSTTAAASRGLRGSEQGVQRQATASGVGQRQWTEPPAQWAHVYWGANEESNTAGPW